MFYLAVHSSNKQHCFALSSDEFRDAVVLRYQFTPTGLSDINLLRCHALNCTKGDLVIAGTMNSTTKIVMYVVWQDYRKLSQNLLSKKALRMTNWRVLGQIGL